MNISLASLHAFSLAYAESDLFGKWVILSLVGLSMISWIVLLHKVWMIRSVGKVSKQFKAATSRLSTPLLTWDIAALPQPRHSILPHPFAAIYRSTREKAVEILSKNRQHASNKNDPVFLTQADLDLLQAHVTAAISEQNQILEKNLFIFYTSSTSA